MTANRRLMSILLALSCVAGALSRAAAEDALRKEFVDPPFLKKSRPLWFWNGPLSVERTQATLQACKEKGYCGVGILPARRMTPAFMTKEFLAQYRAAVEEAARLGMKLCLYDEYWFPSGSAGGQIAAKYPEALGKRLDMLAADVAGPKQVELKAPDGVLMAAVAMNTATYERRNLAESVRDGQLSWAAPEGNWKIMLFTCVRDGGAGLIDYLDPKAIDRFIELTYQIYYDAFPEHFGKTIDSAFYDEPAMYHVQGGRAWTGEFNAKFRAKHGFDPATLYPALWMDIGPETAAARNLLFGFRAELYAQGFPKVVSDWCRKRGIQLTGHVDQEEMVNPVGLCGDLLKAMKYQEIPAIDQVFQYGRASRAYKLISSAAVNYDRPLVVTECYGGINNMPAENLYKEAMDQFAKGINSMVPHAVWYDPAKIIFQPDLSPTDPTWGPRLAEYNTYIGRLQVLTQRGGQRADIGVLYPIATLEAGYYFGPGNPYQGGITPPEADYMAVGEMLALGARRDFTFVHPETLAERCAVAGGEIRLANKLHPQQYKVFVLPGSKTISLASLEKIRDFYQQGGKVIATTRLPDTASEGADKDAEVRAAVLAIFGEEGKTAANANGGKAWFLPSPAAAALQAALDEAIAVPEVRIEGAVKVAGGNLSYLHKTIDGREVYFFANSSAAAIDAEVSLRGDLTLEWWDPHTGKIAAAETKTEAGATRVRLRLPPVRSVFLVSKSPAP